MCGWDGSVACVVGMAVRRIWLGLLCGVFDWGGNMTCVARVAVGRVWLG